MHNCDLLIVPDDQPIFSATTQLCFRIAKYLSKPVPPGKLIDTAKYYILSFFLDHSTAAYARRHDGARKAVVSSII
jgi:hypothetical protein